MTQLIKLRDLPHNKHLKTVAKNNRKSGNLAEVVLWKKLSNKQFHGLNFDRQRNIGNFIVDFYCPAKKFAIEVDGDSHIGKEEYDKSRDEYLAGLEIQIFHIKDSDVLYVIDTVLEELANKILK